MRLYCGIDLHSTNSVVAVIDEDDRRVFERRLANELELVVEALAPYRESLCGCVVESTYNWYWLVDGLMDEGFRVHLANTAALRQYDGLKYSDDHSDARYLAHLLRLGILPEGHIYPRERRAVRDLLRRRLQLVRSRTVQVLSVQGSVARHTGRRLSGNAVKALDEERIVELFGVGPVAQSIAVSCALIGEFERAVERLEREAHRLMRGESAYRVLTTMPGVGRVLGLTIALETGDVGRFADAGHYASYARCVKSERWSNGRRKGEGNRKSGNRYLAWAFIEAAHFAIRYERTIQRYYERKRAKTHPLVALKAVAHKLARAAFHMMREGTRFELARAFG